MCTKIELGLYLTNLNSKPTEKPFLIDIHKCATMERENRVESFSDYSRSNNTGYPNIRDTDTRVFIALMPYSSNLEQAFFHTSRHR